MTRSTNQFSIFQDDFFSGYNPFRYTMVGFIMFLLKLGKYFIAATQAHILM